MEDKTWDGPWLSDCLLRPELSVKPRMRNLPTLRLKSFSGFGKLCQRLRYPVAEIKASFKRVSFRVQSKVRMNRTLTAKPASA